MAVFLTAMAAITVIDVAGRYLFNAPLKGGYEIVQYLMALTVCAALPLASRSESHLTVSLVTGRFRGALRRVHRFVILMVSAAALALIAWRMMAQAAVLERTGAQSGSLRLPLAPIAEAMAWLGWLSVAVVVVLMLRAAAGLDREAEGARGSLE